MGARNILSIRLYDLYKGIVERSVQLSHVGLCHTAEVLDEIIRSSNQMGFFMYCRAVQSLAVYMKYRTVYSSVSFDGLIL